MSTHTEEELAVRPATRWQRLLALIAGFEDAVLALLMLALVLLSAVQIGRRLLFNDGWVDSETVGRNLVLWVAVLGALAATRERRHVAIDLLVGLPQGWLRHSAQRAATAVAALGCGFLAWFGWGLLLLERDMGGELIPGLPAWLAVSVIPFGFALMCLRFTLQTFGPMPQLRVGGGKL